MRKYNMAPANYNKHPKKDCNLAISKQTADGSQYHGGAAPIPVGDKTT
jgi:hypothetical protein